jgi:type VI secretion system protein ImpJ
LKFLSRIVWTEGMHLAQHHFQAQSRYFEDLTSFTLSSLFYHPYGFVAQELDAEALLNGTVSLTHARGVMPDGTPFHFPEDALPDPIDISSDFPPTHDAQVVHLALPRYVTDRANVAEDGMTSKVRYQPNLVPLPDETSGTHEKTVALARKNFRLLLGDVDDPDMVTLPLARVRRDGAGHFVYDETFIPPCMQIGASARLMGLLGRLLQMLDAKAVAMAAERRQSGAGLADYASREVASFWLTHAIHSAVSPLRHLYLTRTAHPEQLFMEMSRLAGALCTFSLDTHPRSLPLYNHDNLGECFDALDLHIRQHLDVVIPTNYIAIPLRPTEPSFFEGTVTDRRCLGPSHWFLGVRSSGSHGDTIVKVPKLMKICSAKHIARLVKEAYPGLRTEHVPAPPAEIGPRVGTVYFRVSHDEPCWKSIVDTAQIGVYVPAAIADAQLEFAVVLDRK